jgi:hypothetical protein
LLLSPSSRPFAFWASRWGAPVFSGEVRVRAAPSGDLTVGEIAPVVVPVVLPSSCCCLEEHNLEEVGALHHCSASRIFIMQPGCSPPPVVIQKDDYQPCGGEKQAGLRPPSCPQLQGCSSSLLGWEASRVEVLPSAWAGDPLLPLAFGGEGVHRPCGEGELRLRGAGRLQALSAAACLAPWLGWP